MQRLQSPVSYRFREKASVFLTELHPATQASEREPILARLRKRDFDASHHCVAWREGLGPDGACAAWGVDDDGEPGGTAGAPMLRVLEGQGVVDVLAVAIRWFGGTKLGTGGLVRAYTEGVQGALAEAERQGLLEEVKRWRLGTIQVPPEQAHLPFAVLGAFAGVEVLGQAFQAGAAILTFRMPPGREASLESAWQERSRGGQVIWL